MPDMEDLPAGRELDAQAAKAMGLTMAPELDVAQYRRYRPYPVEDRGVYAEVPRYSTDPTAAMECWDWLNRQGFKVLVVTRPVAPWASGRTYAEAAFIYREDLSNDVHRVIREKGVISCEGDSPMHALARAVVAVAGVLKELGVEIK